MGDKTDCLSRTIVSIFQNLMSNFHRYSSMGIIPTVFLQMGFLIRKAIALALMRALRR